MGRQIDFFMIDEDEKELFDFIQTNGDILINKFGNPVTYNAIIHESLQQVFLKSPKSVIKMYDFGILDSSISEVIELDRNTVKGNLIEQGRLYIDMYYLDESGNWMKKEKWLEALYNRYRRWIIKHCKISDDKHWYIGQKTHELYLSGFEMVGSFAAAKYNVIHFTY